jgi:UDP-glucuronate 4-epimerase
MAKVLITGGAGFIGSHLTERLLNDGREVVVIDSFDDSYDPELKRRNLAEVGERPQLTVVEGDIRDPKLVERTYRRHGVAATVHLAARSSSRESVKAPREVADVQQVGTATLLDAARKWGAYTFILGSSASIYGDHAELPMEEDAPAATPLSPYGAAKRAAELQCHVAHRVFGIKVTCLRLFSVIGPRQRPDMATARFTDALLAGQPVPLYAEGSCHRDLLAVRDAVDGIVAALETELDWDVINLGSGVATPVTELLRVIATRLQCSPTEDNLPEQPGDLQATRAATRKATRQLGWTSQTPLEAAVTGYLRWRKDTRSA